MKCFYHNDADGLCAANILYFWGKHKGQQSDFIETDYRKALPFDKIKRNEDIWFLDYLIPVEGFHNLTKWTKNITVIDHYKTKVDKWSEYIKCIDGHTIRGIRDISKSACLLTWYYIFINTEDKGYGKELILDDLQKHEKLEKYPPTMALKYINDWDTWTFEFGQATKFFHSGLYSENVSLGSTIWHEILKNDKLISNILESGRSIYNWNTNRNESYVNQFGFETKIDGVKTFAVNCGLSNSNMFSEDESWKDKWPILSCFVWDGKQWTVSLYSKSVDVSIIAKKYGGGGHKGAAGFVCKNIPFVKSEL